METYTNLIPSFYKSMAKDVIDMLPDCDAGLIQSSFDALLLDFQVRKYAHIRDCVSLGKALEKSLIGPTKLVVPIAFPLTGGSALPEWFYELFCILFHEDGLRAYSFDSSRHITEMAASYVLILRQIFLAFSKLIDLEPDVDPATEIRDFCTRITEKKNISLDLAPLLCAKMFLREFFFGGSDEFRPLAAPFAQWIDNPFGAHGPGAVAGKEEGVEKWFFGSIPGTDLRLYNLYEPLPEYFAAQRHEASMNIDGYSRLAVVPKDLRGHRLICIEPKELMFAQQGLMQVMYQRCEELVLTRQAIDFSSQERSQELSKEDGFSTIDLKDASDRVSKSLCRLLLPTEIFALLTRYRSRGIHITPGDEALRPIETMFTMGNALCFPTETLVFWALTLSTMVCEDNDYCLVSSLEAARDIINHPRSRLVRTHYRLSVFGDDIVIPSRYFDSVCRTLVDAGLVVNTAKSCNDTPVREACGSWIYAKRDCRITRFSYHMLSDTRVWCSWFANASELVRNGFSTTALVVAGLMNTLAPVPFGSFGLPGHRVRGTSYAHCRWNAELQREEYLLPTLSYELAYNANPGEFGLYAYFTQSATQAVSHGFSQRIKWDWICRND